MALWRPTGVAKAAQTRWERFGQRVFGSAVEARVLHDLSQRLDANPRAIEAFAPFFSSSGNAAINTRVGNKLAEDLEELKEFGSPSLRILPLEFLQRVSWVLWFAEPMWRNVNQTWASLIIGQSVDVNIPEGQTRQDGADPMQAWADFNAATGYTQSGGLVNAEVLDTALLGEKFHWFDPCPTPDEWARIEAGANQLTWPTDMRVLDPITEGGISDVQADSTNPTQATLYIRRTTDRQKIEPWCINHWRFPFGSVQLRGRPLAEAAVQDVFRLRQTVVTGWVNQIFRMYVTALIYNRTDPKAKPLAAGDADLPDPLSIMDVPPGADLIIPNLRDATVAGERNDNTADRLLTGRIAQAVGLPFHMVAQEYREANLASLLAANGPVKLLSDNFIARFQAMIEDDVRKVVGHTQLNGQPLEVEVNINRIDFSDPQTDRDSWLALYDSGAISRETLWEHIGIDPEVESRRLGSMEIDDAERTAEAHPLGGWVDAEDGTRKRTTRVH